MESCVKCWNRWTLTLSHRETKAIPNPWNLTERPSLLEETLPPIPSSSRSSSNESHHSPVDWPRDVSWYSFGLAITRLAARPECSPSPSSSSSVRISSSSWVFPLPLLASLLGGGGRGGGVRSVLDFNGRRLTGVKRSTGTHRVGGAFLSTFTSSLT